MIFIINLILCILLIYFLLEYKEILTESLNIKSTQIDPTPTFFNNVYKHIDEITLIDEKKIKRYNLKRDKLEDKQVKIFIKNGINPLKVRFINLPCINYDKSTDIINPKLNIKLPMSDDGKFFDNNRKEIILSDTSNIVGVSVESHKKHIKDFKDEINLSEKGFVILILDYNKQFPNYMCNLETEIIRLKNLDTV